MQSVTCSLESVVCSLQSAVCSLQSANVRHRWKGKLETLQSHRNECDVELVSSSSCSCNSNLFVHISLMSITRFNVNVPG